MNFSILSKNEYNIPSLKTFKSSPVLGQISETFKIIFALLTFPIKTPKKALIKGWP